MDRTILAMDDCDRFADLACLMYAEQDGPERWAEAEALWSRQPDLVTRSPAAAAAAGDHAVLHAMLENEPAVATRTCGPRPWTPLMYACYSRIRLSTSRTAACVGDLLRHGADANAHQILPGGYRFTALTGACGGGEQGPLRQPPHRDWRTLAEQLLAAGAEANDAQVVYNRHFEDDDEALRLLLMHGLEPTDRVGWPVSGSDGVLRPCTIPTMTWLLPHAIAHGRHARVELLLSQEVRITGVELPYGETRTIPHLVAVSGDLTMRALFEEHGIAIPTLSGDVPRPR